MFVSYLKRLDESKFRAFMLSVEDGQSFETSFNAAFGMGIEEAWQKFVGQLNHTF